jgi:hypothetical protein
MTTPTTRPAPRLWAPAMRPPPWCAGSKRSPDHRFDGTAFAAGWSVCKPSRWHWRRLWAPRAPQAQHQGGYGREGVTIDFPQVDCSTCPTTRAEHLEPRRLCDQRSSDRRRPQHVTAGSKLLVPALDDCLRLGARRRRQSCRLAAMAMSRPRVRTPIAAVSSEPSPQSSR